MSRARLALPYVLVAALGVRLLAAVGVEWVVSRDPGRQFLIAGDAAGYWELGERLLDGRPFALYDPPRYALRMPGFPVVLATGMLMTGGSRFGVRCWLALIGAVACGLVYLLGTELRDEATGLVAAGVTAISPTLVGFSVLVLSETTFALAMLASLLAFAVMLRRRNRGPARGWAAVVGVTIAAAVYARPAWILVAPLFAGIDLVSPPRWTAALVRSALIAGGLVLALSPWIVRNRIVTGHTVATTLWLGPTLYDGLHPGADGGSDMQFYEDDRDAGLTAGMTEYQVDRHYRSRAWQFVRDNPGRVVVLGWAKQLRYWSPWPNAPQFRHPLGILAVLSFFVPMILLSLFGARSALASDPRTLLIVFGPILYFAALHTVFVGSLRYRLPAEYPLWIAAAAGLLAWRSNWHRWLSVIPAAVSETPASPNEGESE